MPGFLLVSIALAAVLVYLPFLAVGYGGLPLATISLLLEPCWPSCHPMLQRATWAHENAFESMIIYAPGGTHGLCHGQESTVALGAAVAYLVAKGAISSCFTFWMYPCCDR